MNQEKEIIVGGQAVIEGVMMRAPNLRRRRAAAGREHSFKIGAAAKLADKYPILKTPWRGAPF